LSLRMLHCRIGGPGGYAVVMGVDDAPDLACQ
jgi:hypothetical protein